MSDSRFVLAFDEPSLDPSTVGGKAANLARLSRAGFRVPAGFVVTTDAYAEVVAAAGLEKSIADLLDGIDLDDPGELEERSGRIRALIERTDPPPAVAAAVREAYERVGGFVAVRSSGTAEDLAETSFAGLHDTYLDVRGADRVLAAVRRCWASMWTARAVAYRDRGGFDQFEVRIAVVVQEMVAAEVSGVMFTGNPRTAATDEIVVNAGWGLGEAVVSGLITPDEYVIRARDLSVKTAIAGDKSVLIRRADSVDGTVSGTVTEDVPDERRETLTLTDEQAAELADLGRRVQREYHEIPQDIEWALVGTEFHLLQARPVTGVDFSWDNEVEPPEKGADDDTIWDRAWGDTAFTGAISPLYYSCRAHTQDRGLSYTMDIQGLTEASELKHFKYYRGADYYNTATEKALALHTIWPFARDSPLCWGGTEYIEPAARAEIVAAPYDWTAFGVRQLRMNLRRASSWLGNIRVVYDRWVNDPRWDPENFPADTLPRLSDEELKRFTFRYLEEEYQYFEDVWIGFVHFRDAINLLAHLVGRWYDGPNPTALADLLTGVPGTSATMDENNELWGFADRIRRSPSLRAAFDANPGPAFLTALDGAEKGRAFLADYRDFVRRCGHRGHSDRDIWYARRVEDPWIDYRSWQAFLSTGDTTSPADREREMRGARDRAIDDVLGCIRKKPLGWLKAELLHQVIDFVGKWLILRDDERASLDRHTYNLKLIFAEAGRRMLERGIVADERDHYFLSKEELFEHLGGYGNRVLMRAKIAGRRKNFDRRFRQEISLPPYLRHGAEPWDPALEADGDPNRLGGMAQSKGSVTGTARVVANLDRIGSVGHGEILVCNATDPGWTPVFLVISGIVTETGGVLSHAACLSREYGLPAVQLANAMRRIPDGATITVDGDTGEVRIHAEEIDAEEIDAEEVPA